MHKFILSHVRQHDSAAILIAYLPISDDWTILDMLKHAMRNFSHGAIEGFKNVEYKLIELLKSVAETF